MAQSAAPPTRLETVLKLEVPVIVHIATRVMRVEDVMNIAPGAIIELPKRAEDELDILVNNKTIGHGRAVKVGENFGIRVSYIGDLEQRVKALGSATLSQADDESGLDTDPLAGLTDAGDDDAVPSD